MHFASACDASHAVEHCGASILPGEWYRWTEHPVRIECIAVVFA
ncbi:hypothetical protein HMPREF1155_1473 [Slackia sp. CM382]|nr:hypothetical protein HMPREF1155_1473 [Slackia sp. CM382]